MDRRKFLRNGTLASLSISGLHGVGKYDNLDTFDLYKKGQFDINETTIDVLQQKMQSGALSSVAITKQYIDRIQKIDSSGPSLNAVIELNPDALGIAGKLDEERRKGKVRGPMHGIPVLIKDNINTGDKMQTTAGALALAGNIASTDAYLVTRLRAAGAVILGKTNLSEWANFRSSRSCSGWSSRGQQTKNPYLLSHNPCGSSSGSGVAASANLCVVAVGTETDGSVTCPASVNGIVGLKPTVGLISRSGIIPISHTQDTAGPMARTVKDMAILLGALAGGDPNDPITEANAGKVYADYTKFLDPKGLEGKRIGIEKKFQGDNPYLIALWNKNKTLLTNHGAELIEIEYLDKYNALGESEFLVLKYEFKHGVDKYLGASQAKVRSLKEVIAFNKQNPEKTMPYFNQDTLEACDKLGGLDSREYLEALEKSSTGSREIINSVMVKHNLDAIAGLTMGPACSIDRWYGDRWGDVSLTTPAATSGFPHISIPCGLVYGLPVGLSFFAGAYTEPLLISIGYAFELASRSRVQPAFKKAFEELHY